MRFIFIMLVLPVICVTVLHVTQAVSLIIAPNDVINTSVAGMLLVIPSPYVLAASLLFSSACAMVAIHGSITNRWMVLLLLIPQQTFLLIVMIGVAIIFIDGVYFSGVIRSRWFIICDQMPRIILLLLHAGAMLSLARFRRR